MSSTKSPNKKSKLNPKQELFVLEYLKDFNAKQAAIRSGYNPDCAGTRGSHLLDRPEVQERIAESFKRVTSKVEVSVEFVLRELMNMANCNIQDAFNPDGTLKNIHDIPIPVAKSIASFNNEELFERDGKQMKKIGTLRKVTFWDKKGSIELLGKYLAMFVERQRHEGVDGQALPSVQVHIHKHTPALKVEEAATRPVVTEAIAEQVNAA